MEATPIISIVVAVKDGTSNVPALLDTLARGGDDTEIIICSAGPAPEVGGRSNATALSFPTDTLIPTLWSEGILHARGVSVALTTAQFVPRQDWLERLWAADLERWAGVGGAIDNDPKAPPRNWAIFFLRYSAFAPPLRAGETDEIAADNAIYSRAAIAEHPDLLQEGFWEPSFHRRFRAAGRKLMLDPELVVVHHGTVSARSFARQRYLHGRAYGIERAQRGSAARNLLLLVSSPLIAPLLLARIVSRVVKRPRYRSKLIVTFPWLVCFTLAWAAGEVGGYLSGARSGRRRGIVRQLRGHA
jgi:hypothetical protein